MRTIKLSFLFILLTIGTGKASALVPMATYTFVNPCMPFASFNAIPNTYGCFSFSATNAGAVGPNSYYSWDFGDGTTAIGDYVSHCYNPCTVTTVYTVTIAYNSPVLCGPLPTQQSYTLILNPPLQNQCVGNTPSVTLSANSVTVWTGVAIPETIFLYNYGDGTMTGSTNTHQYVMCGNYIINVKNWNMNSPQNICDSYAAVNIACPTLTTGINESSAEINIIELFPNPADEVVTIISKLLIYGIKVVDIRGREWFNEMEINAAQFYLKVSEYPAGTFFLKLKYNNGSEKNIKFIKR